MYDESGMMYEEGLVLDKGEMGRVEGEKRVTTMASAARIKPRKYSLVFIAL